jgi:hypothetical protein
MFGELENVYLWAGQAILQQEQSIVPNAITKLFNIYGMIDSSLPTTVAELATCSLAMV